MIMIIKKHLHFFLKQLLEWSDENQKLKIPPPVTIWPAPSRTKPRLKRRLQRRCSTPRGRCSLRQAPCLPSLRGRRATSSYLRS